jgi:hypothetical protein
MEFHSDLIVNLIFNTNQNNHHVKFNATIHQNYDHYENYKSISNLLKLYGCKL